MTGRDPSDMLPVAPALVMAVYCSSRAQGIVHVGGHLSHMQPRLDGSPVGRIRPHGSDLFLLLGAAARRK